MSKEIPAYVILGFWIILPLAFMLLGYHNYMRLDFEDTIAKFENPTVFNILGGFISLFGIYIKTFIMTIPDAPIVVNYILLFIKAVSVMIAIFILRS